MLHPNAFKKVSKLFLSSVLVCLLGLSGCTPKPSAKVTTLGSLGYVAAGSFSEAGDFIPRENDKVLLSKDFTIQSVRGVSLDGIKKVQLKVENNIRRSLQLEYRFVWYDANGMDVSADSDAWQPFVVEGRSAKTIASSSKSILAQKFEIYIRKLEHVKR